MSLPELTLDVPPILDLDATSEQDAITETAHLIKGSPMVADFPAFLQAVLDRQRINPPILGNFVALPHARTPLVNEIIFAAARSSKPIPFGPEQKPVRLIFLFGVPPHRVSKYLAVTAALVRLLKQPGATDSLLNAPTVDEFLAWLK